MNHLRNLRGGVGAWILTGWVVLLPFGASQGTASNAVNTVSCPHVPPGMEELPECAGHRATCVGSEGSDLILGTATQDVIVGGAGADVIIGYAGGDVICGGAGNDSLMGGGGEDRLYGESGSDWLFGARGDDVLDGGSGEFDVLWGGPGFDSLDGGGGEQDVCMLQRDLGEASVETCETIFPPPGYEHGMKHETGVFRPDETLPNAYRPAASTITCPWIAGDLAEIPECGGRRVTCVGTAGNDLIYGSAENDVIWAGPGNDVVHADTGNDIVCGGPGMDSLMGASGNDLLFGEEDDDWLFGATGDDQLFGGPGDRDVLWAGPGEDELDGGDGTSDVCLLEGCRNAGSAAGAADPGTCETVYPAERVDEM